MTRLSTCIALALALVSSTLVMAQDPIVAPTLPVGCMIATPQKHLTQGHPEEIEFQNCKGIGNVWLRYGNEMDLATDKTPACPNVQFTGGRDTCTFTADRPGLFVLSTTDGSNVETFSGDFTVDPAPVVEAHGPAAAPVAKAVKGDTAGPHVQGLKGVTPGIAPQAKKIPASVVPKTESLGGATQKVEPMGGTEKGAAGSAFAKRALYDMAGFLAL
ncbi:hypothetical protein KI688_012919 [Linnemannia hyalina]|uniref:Uncharacterized protein n=1 Tax=Linnemannia hyalina TaxID=64524 RepID=A0A9P7XTU8_9FUNG|nr:hypothetical protein KI688_012919 [Linnemannia hyalina]